MSDSYLATVLSLRAIRNLVISSLALDLGAGAQGLGSGPCPVVKALYSLADRFIGFKNWSQPFSDSYLGIQGRKGQFLGFWTVVMQAFFSFSGSEIAGIVSSGFMFVLHCSHA